MSGGTSTVINSTLVGVIRTAKLLGIYDCVYAGIPGIQGVLNEQMVDLLKLSESQLVRMRNTPGSGTIGTTRVAILSDQEMSKLMYLFNKYDIQAFINIGGNGTIKQTRSIAAAVGNALSVAAAPKTVDNDLGDVNCTEMMFTPGFPSCVNHWARTTELLNLENIGACSHDKVLVAQTFGRETGFIAGSVRIADPERDLPLLLLLPEDPEPLDKILGAVDDMLRLHGRAIIVMSEGYNIGDVGSVEDATGQTMYGSSRTTAAQLLTDAMINNNIQARSYIPTIIQRQAMEERLEFDLDIAERQGIFAVKRLAYGDSEFLATVRDPDLMCEDDPIGAIPFSAFSNYSRSMQEHFIDKGRFDVTNAYVHYLQGLFRVSRFERQYSLRNNEILQQDEIVTTDC